uniref:HMG box domain-containing protein n=1 Tax=Guillardia theta TaxID=55529 RepID=A0A7S4L2Z8_GUITH
MDGKALSPTLIAFVVTRLLETYFQDFVDTSFTARMEEELDRIARGEMKKEEYLSRYYLGDDGLRNKVEISESRIIPEEARQVKLPTLEPYEDEFQVLVGSYGAYVQARRKEEGKEDSEGGEGKEETQHNLVKANIPQTFCKDVNQLTPERIRKCLETKQGPYNGILIGRDDDNEPILLRVGPYGLYLQKGEGEAEGKTAKKVALPQDMDPQGISLETAKAYLNLPRVICDHPETGSAIQVGIGRYGTFLLYQGSYRSLPATDDIFTLDCSRAVEIINSAAVSPRSTRVIAELGEYERRRVAVVQGRFGPYIKCGLVNAKLPEHHKDSPEDCTLEEAIESIKLKSPQKGKSTPKKKDSPASKGKAEQSASPSRKSRSSYAIFSAEKRPQLKEKGLSFGEISKELASMWSELSQEDKAPYDEMARLEKLKYQEESEEERTSTSTKSKKGGSSSTRSSATKKAAISRLKSINKTTKKPLSAYLHFCSENRPLLAQQGLSFGEISKKLAENWRAVDEATKRKYEDMVRKEKMALGQDDST